MKNFYELLKEKAAIHPAKPALFIDEKSISYNELLDITDRLSEELDGKRGLKLLIFSDEHLHQLVFLLLKKMAIYLFYYTKESVQRKSVR